MDGYWPLLIRDCPSEDNQSIVEGKESLSRKQALKGTNQMCKGANRKRYPSDLTDAQWELIEPFLPKISPLATVETIDRREIMNAIFYVLRTGCSWRQMPHDLPNGKTAHHYFRIWTKLGIWELIMDHLRKQVRTR